MVSGITNVVILTCEFTLRAAMSSYVPTFLLATETWAQTELLSTM